MSYAISILLVLAFGRLTAFINYSYKIIFKFRLYSFDKCCIQKGLRPKCSSATQRCIFFF